ncbi:DUF3618 domain-containing protein [Halomonas sp. Bachu 37]|uniref:DUF3618 domain-containing protein n=1 Tax=Halomonas kashgarensis TaxID=3084920 RepID=UPI0032162B72
MSEHNGQRSSEEIEKDIDRSRERLDSTLHEIEERFSPQQLLNTSYEYLRHGGANEFVSNLSNTIKQNPVPFLLTSAGLGWMIMSQRNPNQGRQHRHDDSPYMGNDAVYRQGTAHPSGNRYPNEHYSTPDTHTLPGIPVHEGTGGTGAGALGAETRPYGSASGPSDSHSQGGGSHLGGMKDSAKGMKDSAKGMKEGAKNKAQHVGDKARDMGSMAREKAQQMGERAQHMGGNMRDKTSHLQHGTQSAMHDMSHRARRAGSQSSDFIQEHPLVVGALGFALGAALGGVFPSTRKEDEYMGEYRDRALQKAAQTGQEQMDKAQETIHEKAESAKESSQGQDSSQQKDTSRSDSTSHHENSAASGKNPVDNNTSAKSSPGTSTTGTGASTSSTGKSTPTGAGSRNTGLTDSDTPSGNTQGTGTNRTPGM